jgi:hypothetical protein
MLLMHTPASLNLRVFVAVLPLPSCCYPAAADPRLHPVVGWPVHLGCQLLLEAQVGLVLWTHTAVLPGTVLNIKTVDNSCGSSVAVGSSQQCAAVFTPASGVPLYTVVVSMYPAKLRLLIINVTWRYVCITTTAFSGGSCDQQTSVSAGWIITVAVADTHDDCTPHRFTQQHRVSILAGVHGISQGWLQLCEVSCTPASKRTW